MIPEIGDLACARIAAAIESTLIGENAIKAILDPYNPTGSTSHVRFTTSKPDRWQTRSDRCHINYAILDSGWEGEFCRVVESHPAVTAYVKNQNLGLEVPYLYKSETRKYIPDFIVKSGDLNLIIEIKGYRGEDAKARKDTMDNYWIPGVNNLRTHGHWKFAELTEPFKIEEELNALL